MRAGAVAPAVHRLAMLRGAIAANPAFAIDETDLAETATGFTADLLPLLRARYPGATFAFIAGQDSLVDSPWRRFDEVLAQLDAFAVAPRRTNDSNGFGKFVAALDVAEREKVKTLELPLLHESASLVRDRIARGETVRYLVPEFVARYIEENRVYA